jgi:hypothetical protein
VKPPAVAEDALIRHHAHSLARPSFVDADRPAKRFL